MHMLKVAAIAVASLFLSACGYNTLQVQDEAVKAAWSEVVNQYQRRADLIPNLVNTVKGFAAQEQDVLVGVTEARARATQIQVDANNPESLKQFQAAQGELSSALSRLMVVVENYPELKSDQNFRDLQAQLEGTENRITVARNRYIEAVQDYNVTVRTFPTNLTAMVFGYDVKPNFTVENEAAIATPPTVDFSSTPAPAERRRNGRAGARARRRVRRRSRGRAGDPDMALIASGRPWLRLLAALSCAVGALACGPAFTQALVAVPPLTHRSPISPER